jgi:putative transposase
MSLDDLAHRWARLRFAVVGPLLASPLPRGKLHRSLLRLSRQTWVHPITGEQTSFGFSTIEAWYYQARDAQNPIDVLRRKLRSDIGQQRAMSARLLTELERQYREHPGWSYQLHADNLAALVKEKPELGPAPSYSTVARRMKKLGWLRRKRPRTDGERRAFERLEQREVRSFEKQFVHELWHFDFHDGSRKVVTPDGVFHVPQCLCILDDYSRLCCHVQWFLHEDTQALVHGLIQAFLKRGLPRGALSDNGSAMLAAETRNGMEDLSIVHETTVEYSPYQNAKQETFWGQLEGRLMSMLELVEPLTLEYLNRATQAFVEMEYNRSRHSEIGCTPLDRALSGRKVARPCPPLEMLRFHFTVNEKRTQRRSDGTCSIKGVRFELPSRLRHLTHISVRYQRWDLSTACVVDPRDHNSVIARIHPLDKLRNADGHRRAIGPTAEEVPAVTPVNPVPPLLRQLLSEYAATGLPPAYIPLDETQEVER